ncbi:kinase-like domain-containing protein [Aspergillus transmontanensis]|uniref:Kinase-like domain-containing protein n=1 Tax=Aspergillus transmontanensis TaxID=1034304 RepID=A0A5N6WC10_9EURO|nr:kinase-like domain-containing protein [Aspergillus transmontanensis]
MANEYAYPSMQDANQFSGGRPGLRHPRPVRYASTPSYESPRRHYRRNPIARRPVKETLNARSEYTTSQDDGTAEHRINQYVIKQEIGRGSFGAVHLATDQFGNEYAVKEFSKARLRKRAQSHLLRRPRGPKRPSDGFNSPLHRRSLEDPDQKRNALYLIKEEIAIMKKLHHPNLVSLIEVLDDPTEDSLYMVMEMCKKGVVMKVGLEERADPYDDELCRCWFRDLVLGIEYLHAQGIVHRDIKPDNCLITSDDVLKVVDFGVSEMFEKDSDMFTAKSAGSPAFLPPELCVVKHGDVSGKAADIWSMGVTLYCLRYGRLPFEKQSIFELYEAIKTDPVACEGETDENFKDLMSRILEKDPTRRIQMSALRMKAVKNFKRLIDPAKADPPMQSILGQEYETHFVQPPLEMEPEESFAAGTVSNSNKSQSLNTFNRNAWQRDDVLKGYHLHAEEPRLQQLLDSTDSSISGKQDPVLYDSSNQSASVRPEGNDSSHIPSSKIPGASFDDSQTITTPGSSSPQVPLSRTSSVLTKRSIEGTRGHARDPLEEEFPFLFIGPSTYTGSPPTNTGDSEMDFIFDEPDSMLSTEPSDINPCPVVSESPGAAEFDIYETAYRQEIERIRTRSLPRQGTTPKVYLTRRVEGKDEVMKLVEENIPGTVPEIGKKLAKPSGPSLSSAVSAIRAQLELQRQQERQDTAARTQHQE